MSIQVQNIACTNAGAFVMSFYVEINGDLKTASTEDYDAGQFKTIPLGSYGLGTGDTLVPMVNIVAGKSNVPGPPVEYAENGGTATYRVTGTTFDPTIILIGDDSVASDARAPGEPLAAH